MKNRPDDEDPAHSYTSRPVRRRRFSPWTIIAPAAAAVLWVSFFSALGKSCVFRECAEPRGGAQAASDEGDVRNDLPRGARVKIKTGDTFGSIAQRFDLTEDELKACNPNVDPQSLQPDRYVIVSAVNCEDADKAEAGANPDPLAGDTTAGAEDAAVNNGTAKADPSATQGDGPSDQGMASADQGDEG